LERILAAKAEILDRAGVGVICVDHPLLARLSEERSASMPIVSVSTGERGRVQVTNGLIVVDGLVVGDAPDGAFGANLAVAVGVCVALDLTHEVWARRLADLPNPAHRQTVSIGESGVTIIDDTFNSNPDGAKRALATLGRASNGAKAVVTPGMVELGPVQEEENTVLAREVAAIADHLVIVGRTNRASLLSGAADGGATVTVVGSREEAVAWVRANLSRGDTVLYENDLPDHYP
jgi:UDP-N-acetylmuramoyl-tripeptide--D-alanyl-D-alanine ligase